MIIQCLNCNDEFRISPSRLGKRKYCSAKCRKEYENREMKTKINCKTCNVEFWIYKHELQTKKYCSKKCHNKSMRVREKFNCSFCGKEFHKKPSRINWDNMYCSKDCLYKSMQNRDTKPCVICGKEITRPKSQFKKAQVCSIKCQNKYLSSFMLGEKHFAFNSDLMKCLVCNKEFFEPKSRVAQGKGKFCSKACKYIYFKEHFAETKNPNWKGGAKDYRGANWKDQRKLALIRDNFSCQKCGKIENLDVHHIIRYAEFNGDYKTANKLSNLLTVCSSCHSRIENRQEILKANLRKANGNTVLSS